MIRAAIHHNIGVRAEGMLLAAGIWTLMGLGVVMGTSSTAPGAWHVVLPLWLRVLVWWGPAVVALVTAPSVRWSPMGLALLQIGPVLHLCSHFTSWLIDVWPGPPPGDPNGWYRAGFYVALVALVVLLSHIPSTVQAPLSGRPR